MIYPPATAQQPLRDQKGQNLRRGTDANQYIKYEGNQSYGATATWKDNRQPDKNIAGVQNLTALVSYPGISTPVEVPVKVWVYNFIFEHPIHKIEVGETFPKGTWAGNYVYLENGAGLPTNGFLYYWNKETAGTISNQWQDLAYTSTPFIKTGKYEVLSGPSVWQKSQPGTFIVTHARPNPPTITESNTTGDITITPGTPRPIEIRGTNSHTEAIADKIVIKKNGNKLTTFVKDNQNHWIVQSGEHNLRGISPTNDGSAILLNRTAVSIGDTLEAIATAGAGEILSPEATTGNFIVKSLQPNQANAKAWENGTFEITPDARRNILNPTDKVEIAYIEKIASGNETPKTHTVIRNNNGVWSISNKPSYVTVNQSNGKVLFTANTIKPNSQVTVTSKAGSGNTENTNPNVITAPPQHNVTINEIIKEQGQSVSSDDINNAVQVTNKRNAVVKHGSSLPRNLAGGSTTHLPVIITYNDGSNEEITELIKAKVDKTELINSRNHLDETISKENKTPTSIRNFDQALERAKSQIAQAKSEADSVIQTEFATPQQLSNALNRVKAAQAKIDEAKNLLQTKADNSQLVRAKNQLQQSLQPPASTDGMTQQTAQNYNLKRQSAEQAIQNANSVINNGDATTQDINNAKNRIEQAQREYNEAKNNLRAEKSQLQNAYNTLIRNVETNDKKPSSVNAYQQALERIKNELNTAKSDANNVLNNANPSVSAVRNALQKIEAVQPKVNQAIGLLQQKANNSQLVTARDQLQSAISPELSTDGMTQNSANEYKSKLQLAKQALEHANTVINNGDATAQQISNAKNNVQQAEREYLEAKDGLRADKSQLENAYNHINQPVNLIDKKPSSVERYKQELNGFKNELDTAKAEANSVLNNNNPSVEQVRNALSKVNAVQTKVNQAEALLQLKENNSALVNAKQLLENAINQVPSTEGMTEQTIANYNTKKQAAQAELQKAEQVIANGNASANEISNEKAKVEEATTALNKAKTDLRADKSQLQAAYNELTKSVDTSDKTPASVKEYNKAIEQINSQIKNAKSEANSVLQNDNPTVNAVKEALRKIQAIQPEVTKAINLLHQKANNSELVNAKEQLQRAVNSTPSTTGMTQQTIETYNEKQRVAQQELQEAQNVINNGDATSQQISAEKDKVEQALQALNNAKNGLRADKSELQTAYQQLNQNVDTNGKTPASIKKYQDAKAKIQTQIDAAQNEAKQVLDNDNPSVSQVNDALNKIKAVQPVLTKAIHLLENKANNSELVTAKDQLQAALNNQPSTTGMTQESINNYNAKRAEAQNAIIQANSIIDNGDATAQQITDEKSKVDQALQALNDAKQHLTADTTELQNALNELNRTGDTNNKKPNSIEAYNNAMQALQSQITNAKNNANAVIQKPIRTVSEVNSALQEVNQVNQQLTETINKLQPLANNESLKTARTQLEDKINETIQTEGMTQQSVNAYEHAKQEAQSESDSAQALINNGNATDQEISAEIEKVNQKLNSLSSAITGLTVDKEPLETIKSQLQNNIDTPPSIEGMTQLSVDVYKQKLQAAKDEINTINNVLANNPNVEAIKTNKATAERINNDLTQAKQSLKVDTQPLQTAMKNIQTAIDAGTNTDGMTADSVDNFNDSLSAALIEKTKINKLIKHTNTLTVEQVNQAVADANQVINNLNNARASLIPDKEPLETAKEALENSINQPTDTEGMTTQTLQNYNEKLNAAKQELNKDKGILNGSPTVAEIRAATSETTKIQQALDNARSQLVLDRQPFIEHVNNKNHLNTPQKDKYNEQINSATNYRDLVNIQNNANALDQAMKTLADSVANYEHEKQNINYLDGSSDKRQAYDDAVNAAKGILNQTQNPTMSSDTVNQKAQKVQQTKDALDGQQRLTHAKEQAINHLNNLHNLNKAQRRALTDQINHSDNIASVNQAKDKADNVNTAMTGLKQSVADNNTEIQ